MKMREYTRLETLALLRRLSLQVERTADSPDEDAVHDLRVSVRRLSRCLRIFGPFYAGGRGQKFRSRLRELMAPAGAVRDIDIAMDLMSQAGFPPHSAIIIRLAAARREKGRILAEVVRRWRRRRLRQWSRKLGMPL